MMKAIRVVALVVVLALLVSPAAATLLESCCACLPPGINATTSGAPVGIVAAAFCAEADATNLDEVTMRCDALGDGFELVCVANVPGPTCFDQLAGDGIACPTAGVPAAAPPTLLAALVLLVGFGGLALRRR